MSKMYSDVVGTWATGRCWGASTRRGAHNWCASAERDAVVVMDPTAPGERLKTYPRLYTARMRALATASSPINTINTLYDSASRWSRRRRAAVRCQGRRGRGCNGAAATRRRWRRRRRGWRSCAHHCARSPRLVARQEVEARATLVAIQRVSLCVLLPSPHDLTFANIKPLPKTVGLRLARFFQPAPQLGHLVRIAALVSCAQKVEEEENPHPKPKSNQREPWNKGCNDRPRG